MTKVQGKKYTIMSPDGCLDQTGDFSVWYRHNMEDCLHIMRRRARRDGYSGVAVTAVTCEREHWDFQFTVEAVGI